MRALLVLTMALVACTDTSALSPEEQDLVAAAAAWWRPYTKPEVGPYCTTDAQWGRCLVHGRWVLLSQTEDLEPPTLGRYHRREGHIEAMDGLALGTWLLVVKHELGHAMGMEHTATGVMRAMIEEGWTPEVEAECRRVGACP